MCWILFEYVRNLWPYEWIGIKWDVWWMFNTKHTMCLQCGWNMTADSERISFQNSIQYMPCPALHVSVIRPQSRHQLITPHDYVPTSIPHSIPAYWDIEYWGSCKFSSHFLRLFPSVSCQSNKRGWRVMRCLPKAAQRVGKGQDVVKKDIRWEIQWKFDAAVACGHIKVMGLIRSET